jgi:hypothetical protein
MKKLLIGAAAAAALAMAGGAHAATTIYTFNTTAVAAFGAGPYGEVDVTDSASGLTFDVSFLGGLQFHDANDSNHTTFAFNLNGGTDPSNILPAGDFFVPSGSSFNATPFGTFTDGLECTNGSQKPPKTPCQTGFSALNPTTLHFFVSGATLNELSGNPDGNKNIFFVADVVNANGDTGSIGATLKAGVPEPATWAMMLVGFGGLGAMLRRQRRTAQAAVA